MIDVRREIVRPPAPLAEKYLAEGHWTDETHDAFLRERARRFAERPAVTGPRAAGGASERVTYRELDARADRFAAVLAAQGIGRGDAVIVQLPNCQEYLPAVFGVFRAGAVPLFSLPAHRESELAHFVATSGARMHIVAGSEEQRAVSARLAAVLAAQGVAAPRTLDVSDPHLAAAEAAPEPGIPIVPPAEASDLAFLQVSGGTTGLPKLIPRTHRDYLYSVRESATICAVDQDTVMLVCLPASHNFTMSSPGILGVLDRGGRIVLAPDPSPRTAFRLIEEERVTMASLVPPLLQSWLASPARARFDLSSLDVLQVGGARLPDAVAERVAPELGARLQQVFGMAEGLVNYTRLGDPDDVVLHTQGRPISPDDEVRVVDADDRDVPDGVEGHLLTRGPYTIRGYFRADRVNEEAFTADGFYRSGDLVIRRPDGYLVVSGRAKEQINRAGEKIAPAEVEEVLVRHPAVADAVVVGVPDEYLGERIHAVVLLRTGSTVATGDLLSHLRGSGLAAFKVPDRLDIADELPLTGVGKMSRRALRRQILEELSPHTNPEQYE